MFIEECIKLDRHIKKLYGPKACFKWQPLYYKAIKYETPLNLRQYSIPEVIELVGVRETAPVQRGRPRLNDDDLQARAEVVREVEDRKADLKISYEQACARIGIPYSTFRDWRKVTKK